MSNVYQQQTVQRTMTEMSWMKEPALTLHATHSVNLTLVIQGNHVVGDGRFTVNQQHKT